MCLGLLKMAVDTVSRFKKKANDTLLILLVPEFFRHPSDFPHDGA